MDERGPTTPAVLLKCSRALALLACAVAVTIALLVQPSPSNGAPTVDKPVSEGQPADGENAKSPAIAAIAARLEQHKGKARLVFETTAAVTATAFPVAGPDRIVVDLPEVAFRIDPAVGRLPASHARPRRSGAADGDGLVKSFRFGLFAPGRSRIVIDLARPAKIVKAASGEQNENARFVVELEATDAASFAAEAAKHNASPPEPLARAETASAQVETSGGDKPVVVIDPGHGGIDVGAAGRHGEQEKAIALDFARTLKEKLEASGKVQVLLTRNDDVFMALGERVRFARQHNASLFLSIHADTLGEPSVEGATVYTVSARASDAEAAKIAEKENLADQAAGLEHIEDASEVGDILLDLTRRETRAYSRLFAEMLIARWKTAGNLNKNPSRSAGFVVLKAHDVPSVLLELGYLSSVRDLARLTSPEWREKAATTTAEAIEAYFSTRNQQPQPPAQSVASSARPQ
jgi:N-acetylmuramoyl-L-alanine amidase